MSNTTTNNNDTLVLRARRDAQHVEVRDEKDILIGEFDFNPGDGNIIKRYGHVVDFFNNITFAEGLTADQQIEEIIRIQDEIGAQFDYLLGYKVSDALFTNCGALSVNKAGDFFFETVLEGIGGLIETALDQRVDKKLKKARKATSKYHK